MAAIDFTSLYFADPLDDGGQWVNSGGNSVPNIIGSVASTFPYSFGDLTRDISGATAGGVTLRHAEASVAGSVRAFEVIQGAQQALTGSAINLLLTATCTPVTGVASRLMVEFIVSADAADDPADVVGSDWDNGEAWNKTYTWIYDGTTLQLYEGLIEPGDTPPSPEASTTLSLDWTFTQTVTSGVHFAVNSALYQPSAGTGSGWVDLAITSATISASAAPTPARRRGFAAILSV